MYCQLFLLILLKIVSARISIKIGVDQNDNITISYSGTEEYTFQDADTESFKMENNKLMDAFEKEYGTPPDHVYLGTSLPGDLSDFNKVTSNKVTLLTKVLEVKSARVKGITKRPIIVTSQEFVNSSNKKIKVNAGISYSVENTLTTSWSKDNETSKGLEMSCEVNLWFVNVIASGSVSYSTRWGESEEKSRTETIGTTTGLEIELGPGESATSSLSANFGNLEIEVIYKTYLKGSIVVVYGSPEAGFLILPYNINFALETFGITNEKTTIENINVGFHSDATLKVYDKVNQLILLL